MFNPVNSLAFIR